MPGTRAAPRGEVIRVLASNLPRVLYEVLAASVSQDSNIVIVGNTRGALETLIAVRQGVDVVVLGAPEARRLPAICTHLLGEYPELKIIVVSLADEHTQVYWLGIRSRQVRPMTPRSILATIRGCRG